MCGIMAILGPPNAIRSVLEGLRRLEYRGYDSCGYTYPHNGTLRIVKTVGGVAHLAPEGDGTETLALGHTRWATHGGVTQANAHPHADCGQRIAVVHNGIIENHRDLRDHLTAAGHHFRSETDTEVLPHLLEDASQPDLLDALRATLPKIRGSYSIAALDARAEAVVFAKNSTPLIVGKRAGATLLASDPNALAGAADEVAYIEDGEYGRITPAKVELYTKDGRPKTPHWVRILWDAEESDKAGYPHYMLKEIHETPPVLNRVLSGRVFWGPPYIDAGPAARVLAEARRVKLLGAGTSYHAALLGAHYLRRLANIPAAAELAPEYKDTEPHEEPGTALVAVSQSGETLDTLEALKKIEGHGFPVLALTNNPQSAIARRADAVFPLHAGPEVSVAATKTFLAQTLGLLVLAARAARERGALGESELAALAHDLKDAPRALARLLQQADRLAPAGHFLAKYENLFVLGKGLALVAAQEAALKLKEIAYQHAEAYSAGELKHGPFALLSPTTPVVVLVGRDAALDKVLNNVTEVRARGSPLVLLTNGPIPQASGLADFLIELPRVPELLEPLLFGSAVHLLAYECAKQRGCEIDRPRNLAKSVTVE